MLKSAPKNFKIFLECGDELQESNIDKLTNNGLLLISNDTMTRKKYSQYAKSYYGVKISAAGFNHDDHIKRIRVAMFGSRVGKTSLAERYIFGHFYQEYEPTYDESYRKHINFDNRMSENNNISKVAQVVFL